MEITRTTIVGILILVLLAGGLWALRVRLFAQEESCRRQLTQLAPALENYARGHGGKLPENRAELEQALGYPPFSRPTDRSFELSPLPRRWKSGAPRPYLWDMVSHRFTNTVHVLFTDGMIKTYTSVKLIPDMNTP